MATSQTNPQATLPARVSVPQLPTLAMDEAGLAKLKKRRPILGRFLTATDVEVVFMSMCREDKTGPGAALPEAPFHLSVPQLPTGSMNDAGMRVARLFHPLVGRSLLWSDIEAVYVAMCEAAPLPPEQPLPEVPAQAKAASSPAFKLAMSFASESWSKKFEPVFEGFSPREKLLLKAAFEGGFLARGVLEESSASAN